MYFVAGRFRYTDLGARKEISVVAIEAFKTDRYEIANQPASHVL